MKNKKIISLLTNIVGQQRISQKPEDLTRHAKDKSFHQPSYPDLVVWAKNTKEVSNILQLANTYGIPVTPWGAGSSLMAMVSIRVLPPNESAHRWRPLRDSRTAERCRGAAIRWSALGCLMAVRFGPRPAVQKSAQCIRLLAQFRTFDVPNGKNRRKLLIQLWQ